MSDKLAGVHPKLVSVAMRIITGMHALGFDVIVTDGLRTAEQQAALYAQGRGKPGPIVTNADGVVNRSNHQERADGFGHAVDFCFIVGGKASWDPSLPWSLLGAMARSQGCKWGGDWNSRLVDLPHVELP